MEQNSQELRIGPEAIAYLREYLPRGLRLANFLNRHDLDKGTASVWVPAGTPVDQAVEFETGGKLRADPEERVQVEGGYAGPVHSYDLYLAALVERYLRETEGGICIFENLLARPSDPDLKDYELTLCTVSDEVYHVLTASADHARIDATIAEAKSLPDLRAGALTTLGSDCDMYLINGGEISESCLLGLAARAVIILVGIYDGESYLVWRRSLADRPAE